MADGDDQNAPAPQAQQRGEMLYQVLTHEQTDDHTASAGVTIRPGTGVESVRVRVPGLDEFETGPDQLRDWLRERNLVHSPHHWTDIERQLQEAIAHPHHHQAAAGDYYWGDYPPGGNATEPEREELEEISTADWNRMLAAWQQFQQQVTDLRSIADGDAESIIRQVGHTITALDMIESTGWTHSCAAELGAWESLGSDAVTPDAAHSAATAVADAGDLLMQHWHAALNAGNYDSTQLNDVQAAFLDACAHARAGLHH